MCVPEISGESRNSVQGRPTYDKIPVYCYSNLSLGFYTIYFSRVGPVSPTPLKIIVYA